MQQTTSGKLPREWEMSDMNHHDAGIRQVLLIALEKHKNGEDPVILTTDEVNAEVVRRGLRDPSSIEGKGKGALLGSYSKRESGSNLSPSLLIQIGRGRYKLNLYYLDKLEVFAQRWGSVEATRAAPQVSRILTVQRYLESLHKEVTQLSGKLDAVVGLVNNLLSEETRGLSFVHTSPDFPDSVFDAQITSIKDAIAGMLQRAGDTVRISTRQMDMFEDDLIGLKRANPNLKIVVISRGPEEAEGPRKKIARAAFERMKAAGIKMYTEKDMLHSRMVIVDEKEAVVSSADLDYTQMEKEFNAGIWTDDAAIVAEAIRYFDNLLRSPTTMPAK